MANYSKTLSKKNNYWVPKHRMLELYHHVQQYPDWIQEYNAMLGLKALSQSDGSASTNSISDPTSDTAIRSAALGSKIKRVEKTVKLADPSIYDWLLIGVTQGTAFEYLPLINDEMIPCDRKYYYKARRRFFWLLDKDLG